MPLRILPIANPDNTHPLDNVLSEDVLTTLRKHLADKDSYLLQFEDKGTDGCYIRAVLLGYYIEGVLTTKELEPSEGDDIYIYLNIDDTTKQLVTQDSSPWAITSYRSEFHHPESLHVAVKTDSGWEPIVSSYHRILPRAIDLSDYLFLCCGTALQFNKE